MIGPRRFWDEVAVESGPDGFRVRLDDRPLRTPADKPLRVPTLALAEAIAAEWRAVEGAVRPDALPFTRAANVAIDRVARSRPGGRRDRRLRRQRPALLPRRRPRGASLAPVAAWDPLLDWSAAALGAPLTAVAGRDAARSPRRASRRCAVRCRRRPVRAHRAPRTRHAVGIARSRPRGCAPRLGGRDGLGAVPDRRDLAGRAVGPRRRSRSGGGAAPRGVPACRPASRNARGRCKRLP